MLQSLVQNEQIFSSILDVLETSLKQIGSN